MSKILYKYKNKDSDPDIVEWTEYVYDETNKEYSENKIEEKDKKINSYTLVLNTDWESELGGSPAAIEVTASHEKDQTDTTGEDYMYNAIWGNYEVDGNTEFKGIDDTSANIYIFSTPEELSGNDYIIQQNISKDNTIKIQINRIYSGVITFQVTPIMSYGRLDNLTQTIRIDQNKIASGEILVDTWNYQITESEYTIQEESDTAKEITTTTTVNQGDNSSIVVTETKKVTPTTTTSGVVYNLSLKYGFESYKFEDQKAINSQLNCIKFYDLENLHQNQGNDGSYLGKINTILEDQQVIPDHVEYIPSSLLSGGQLTVNLELNSAGCNIKPNKVYLCIFNIQTYLDSGDSKNEISFLTQDYRYLYTSGIYNDYVELTQDFKNLYLPIIPELEVQFEGTHINSKYCIITKESGTIKEEEKTASEVFSDLKWIKYKKDDAPEKYETPFTFTGLIDNSPKSINFSYSDSAFKCDYTIDFDYFCNKQGKLYLTENINSSDSDDNIIKIKTNSNATKYQPSDSAITVNNEESKIVVDYDLQINYQKIDADDTLQIHALKCNLLNTPIIAETGESNVYLAERAGLNNTIMMGNDSIPAIGLNTPTGSDDEWYLEATFLSEGFIEDGDQKWDDSVDTNSPLELDLQEYGKYTKTENNKTITELREAKKYFLYYGSKEYSESLSEKDPTISLNDILTLDELKEHFNSSFENISTAPLLFLTKGQCTSGSKHAWEVVFNPVSNVYSLSQPHRKNGDDQHSFDGDEPYLYPYWYDPCKIIGTFAIKYADTRGQRKFVLTNNYFSMDFGPDYTWWLKGRVQHTPLSQKNAYPITRYIEDDIKEYGSLDGEFPSKDPKKWQVKLFNEITEIESTSTPCKFYTMGDLYATQLAQFAIITPFYTPKEYSPGDNWYKANVSTIQIENIKKTTIDDQRVYSFMFNEDNAEVTKKISENVYCGKVNLYYWSKFLPSNNLVFNPRASYDYELSEEENNLTASEKSILSTIKNSIGLDDEEIFYNYVVKYIKGQDVTIIDDTIQKYCNQAQEIYNSLLQSDPYFAFIEKRIQEIQQTKDTNTNYPIITFDDSQVFNPLQMVIPDSNPKYMVEITPTGEISIDYITSDFNSNILYYWDGSKYSVYDSHNGAVELYKYGKFTKNIGVNAQDYNSIQSDEGTASKIIQWLEQQQLNPNNYNIISGYDQFREGFLVFHPIEANKELKIKTQAPLKYSQQDKLYVSKKPGGRKTTIGKFIAASPNVSGNCSVQIKGLPYYHTKDSQNNYDIDIEARI